MQQELNAALDDNDLPVEILGCNIAGEEGGNPGMVAGRTLPWLQDTATERVWDDRWHPNWRDLVILDENNEYVGTFVIDAHRLEVPENYRALINRLKKLASRP